MSSMGGKVSDYSQLLSPRNQGHSRLKGQTFSSKFEPSEIEVKPKSPTITEKVVITGDDILIEYVRRLMKAVKASDSEVPPVVSRKIELFLTHKVWYSQS